MIVYYNIKIINKNKIDFIIIKNWIKLLLQLH